MNRIASKWWLDAKSLRQLITKTSAESLSENDLIRKPPSPLSPSRFNGGDCKVTQVIYDTSLASLNVYIVWSINLQMWVLENSACRKLGHQVPVTRTWNRVMNLDKSQLTNLHVLAVCEIWRPAHHWRSNSECHSTLFRRSTDASGASLRPQWFWRPGGRTA